MKKSFLVFSIGIVTVSILLIVFLATGTWTRFFSTETEEYQRPMVITPQEANPFLSAGNAGQTTWDESLNVKIPLEDGEIAIAVINHESEGGFAEEQFVAYMIASDTEKKVNVTYIDYDEINRKYRRLWNAHAIAARPETLSFFSQDLIGDRNNCIVVAGMNNRNEHTMAVFRKDPSRPIDRAFNKIADLQIDGSIIIQETGRSQAYQQGITNGQSFNIAAYGHDSSSGNILDQIETVYSYNPFSGQYEQKSVARIPGLQIEQQRLKELLNGDSGVFENFINDLWYYVSPRGTIDSMQYIYFDPSNREVIFFGNEAQQVFRWVNSTSTRYGLYITSQNISISTLRRRIDIELESLDSIKLRVSEDVSLKIEIIESWDGSYRRAKTVNLKESASSVRPAIDAQYDSLWGRIQFFENGEYTISSGNIDANNTLKKGHYVFFKANENDLLELRPNEANAYTVSSRIDNRTVYKVETIGNVLILSRVRLGTSGIQDLFEPPVTLTPVN